MDGDLKISVDKLPIKRVDVVEENGIERFPSDIGYDEKRVNLIRRVDFAWAVEREEPSKKQKKGEGTDHASKEPWQWQNLVENLQLAQLELSVTIDLIKTVEANDAVTVAGMTRPKQLPSELLSDLSVSTATKLQCFRHLGKYFKQSAKALEQQVEREARFYGALIRLQQNWKVKRHRLVAAVSGNEGFYIDLFDNSLYDSATAFRPPSMSTIPVEHNATGMLAVNLPPNSCRSLRFLFLGPGSVCNGRKLGHPRKQDLKEESSKEASKDFKSDDVYVQRTHSVLREVHRAIFDEQVFDLVNREASNLSLGVYLTGMHENYLQLSIEQETSVSISLMPSIEDEKVNRGHRNHEETAIVPLGSSDGSNLEGRKDNTKLLMFPNQISFEIYLQQIFHEHVFVKAKSRVTSVVKNQMHSQSSKERLNILDHFCMSLAHRIFSRKVLSQLETLVCGIPYVHLISHSTWHSRTSSWTLVMKVPHSILHAGSHIQTSGISNVRNVRPQFWTKVVVIDNSIILEGEGAPTVIGLFKGKPDGSCPINRYECDLADLSTILLKQVASQVIWWLHEEALAVGAKVSRDFLSLAFELEQGDTVRLVANVDPDDAQGCISWWLTIDDGHATDHKIHPETASLDSKSRKFLGYLSLEVLYLTVLDFVNLCRC